MKYEPQLTNIPDSSPKVTEVSGLSSGPSVVLSAPPSVVDTKHPNDKDVEEDEEEDDFAQLARRLFLSITLCISRNNSHFTCIISRNHFIHRIILMTREHAHLVII